MAIKSLTALPTDSRLFIDANIFLYTILGHHRFKSPCEEFLIKLENGEYEGITSTLILNEVVHKLMLAEVVKNQQVKFRTRRFEINQKKT